MALDPALEEAVRKAVKEQGQKPALAERMIAWLEALAQGNLSPADADAFYARTVGAVVAAEAQDAD
jgi:hypothetical protein